MWEGILVYNFNRFNPEPSDKSQTDYNPCLMINLLMYTPQSSSFIPVTYCEHKSKLFELHM